MAWFQYKNFSADELNRIKGAIENDKPSLKDFQKRLFEEIESWLTGIGKGLRFKIKLDEDGFTRELPVPKDCWGGLPHIIDHNYGIVVEVKYDDGMTMIRAGEVKFEKCTKMTDSANASRPSS